MHTCSNKHPLPLTHILQVVLRCDCQHLDFVPRETQTQGFTRANWALGRITAYLGQIVQHIRIVVRIAISEIYGVVIILKVVGESQGVEGFRIRSLAASCRRQLFFLVVFFNTVVIVSYLAAGTVPANVFLLWMFLWIDKNFHPLVEKRIGLWKIEDVKAHLWKLFCVLHSIKEPLSVARSVHIVLKQHVIFIVAHFNRRS